MTEPTETSFMSTAQTMSEGECKACAGRHRAHICGKVKRAATLQESTAVRKPVKTIVKQWPPAVDSTATAGGIATRAPPTDRTAAREAQEAAKRASSPSNGTLQRLLTANCEAANTDRNSVMGTCDDKTVLAAEAQTAPPPIARDELTVAMSPPGPSPLTRQSPPEQSAAVGGAPCRGTSCLACAGKHRPHTCGKVPRTVERTKSPHPSVKRSLSEMVAAEMVAAVAVERSVAVESSTVASRRAPVDRTGARAAQEQEEEAKRARALQRQAEQAELLNGAAHVLQGLLMT